MRAGVRAAFSCGMKGLSLKSSTQSQKKHSVKGYGNERVTWSAATKCGQHTNVANDGPVGLLSAQQHGDSGELAPPSSSASDIALVPEMAEPSVPGDATMPSRHKSVEREAMPTTRHRSPMRQMSPTRRPMRGASPRAGYSRMLEPASADALDDGKADSEAEALDDAGAANAHCGSTTSAAASSSATGLPPARPRTLGTLLGPIDFGFGTLTIEQLPELPVPRMCLRYAKKTIDEAGLTRMLAAATQALELGVPFTVLFDVRLVSLPSRSQLSLVREWNRQHWPELERLLQGFAILLSSMVTRSSVNMMLSMGKPTQPHGVFTKEADAFAFARDKCWTPEPAVASALCCPRATAATGGGTGSGAKPAAAGTAAAAHDENSAVLNGQGVVTNGSSGHSAGCGYASSNGHPTVNASGCGAAKKREACRRAKPTAAARVANALTSTTMPRTKVAPAAQRYAQQLSKQHKQQQQRRWPHECKGPLYTDNDLIGSDESDVVTASFPSPAEPRTAPAENPAGSRIRTSVYPRSRRRDSGRSGSIGSGCGVLGCLSRRLCCGASGALERLEDDESRESLSPKTSVELVEPPTSLQQPYAFY